MEHLLKYGLLAMGLVSLPAAALDTGVEGLTFDGRLRQGFSVAYDLPGQGNQNGPANYVAEVKSSYTPNRDLTFIGNFWLRGDWSPQWDPIEAGNGGLGGGGIIDPASPSPFTRTFPMFLHRKNCNPNVGQFCASSSELRTLDKAEEVIRELSVKYRDPGNRFAVKFGKFQRGWGQSDGLRLLDILHAQDLRERFAFKDSDELRIPALMLATDFNLTELGMAGPFEALGMSRPTLEFNIVPEVFHSKFIINNPTPTDRSSGGIFGLPWPVLSESKGGYGLVGAGAVNLRERTPKNISLEDAEYSMRLKFETLGGEGTINLFYGQQDLPVVKLTSVNFIGNNAYNNPSAPGAFMIPAPYGLPMTPLQASMYVGHGAYLPILRTTGTAPVGVGTPLCGFLNAFLSPGPAPTADCSVTFNFDLDYDYRQKVVGFSFARDLSDTMSFGPKNTSPAIRLEAAYEFDKPFNRSVALMDGSSIPTLPLPPPFPPLPLASKIERGSPALTVHPKDAITKSDVLSTMIGFDYPLWIPGWEKQQKSIFTSFQFFNIYTKDADDGLLAQAPYAYTEVEKNQQYVTFLWNAPIMGERLVLEGLLIKDLDNSGYFYRQRVDFQFFGNKWRPRLEWMHFDGERESAPYGIFRNSDFVELSLTYQF